MKLLGKLLSVLKWCICSLGIFFLVLCVLAFTRVPFDVHRWLGEKASAFSFSPEYIVMLGGSGMPSESNLIRLYYVAELSRIYPDAEIIIAHPLDTAVAMQMHSYLVNSGLDSSAISIMALGTNTREQAMELLKHRSGIEIKKTVIVTSPENMYRTMRVFRKLGYSHTGGVPAFENAMFIDLKYNHEKVGGNRFAPDVSGSIGLRYNFWNYLKLEITCLREFAAIVYYRLNGWI